MTPTRRPSGGGRGAWLVRVAARLVPADRRSEWLEEWRGELAALTEARDRGVRGLPSETGFVLGAFPHALWMRTEGWTVDSMVKDLSYASRVLRRTPGFTIVAALTLALGIGANASIFSLVNGLVLRAPAGIHAPDRLVQVARSYETAPRWDNFSYPALRAIAAEQRVFTGVAGYSGSAFALGSGSDTEQVVGQYVTGNYFEVLGVRPHVGRLLTPADDERPGAHAVVVLGYELWTRRFASDPDVVGDVVAIGARPYEIVGVAPPDFVGAESIGTVPSIHVPMMQHPGYRGELLFGEWGASWIEVIGRLADGASIEEARTAMSVVASRLREAAPVNEEIEVLLAPGIGLSPDARRDARRVSAILAMIAGLVLLMTCTNVANLFLSRASGRRTEMGVRMALGAGRARVARQLVTESSLLALLATALAVPIVAVAGDLLPELFPYRLAVSVGADARVWSFLVVVGLGTGLLFGAAPALTASRRDVAGVLREGASTGGRAKTRLRDALVIAQLGLSLGLVAGAAFLGRSVINARSADPGFDDRGQLAAIIDLGATGRYDERSGTELIRGIVAAAGSTPGVRGATVANQIPLVGGHSRASAAPVGNPDAMVEAEYIVVGPSYFETMGIAIVRGRPLRGFDDEPEPVVVVNEALAAMFWPDREAVGQEIEREGRSWRVVGVARDVQMRSLRDRPNPAIYYPLTHRYAPYVWLQVAATPGSGVDAATLRRTVASLDAELPVGTVVDLERATANSMGETRTIGYLVTVFAGLALVLAIVGLYGLVSYGASQRVREIGIRVALGAEPESLMRLILARGMRIAALGAAVGLVIAYALGVALRGLLFGVSHTDPVVLAGAAVLLLGAAAVAAWLPARRASRVDAAVSLREA